MAVNRRRRAIYDLRDPSGRVLALLTQSLAHGRQVLHYILLIYPTILLIHLICIYKSCGISLKENFGLMMILCSSS